MFEALAFYLFAGLLLFSAAVVITARNPVHGVLFLILAFFNAAGLFVLIGAEFLAFILLIVYVGAVAVLFLFVVMMLDIDFADLRSGVRRHALIGGGVGALLLAELVFMLVGREFVPGESLSVTPPGALTNTEALGRVLYTEYAFPFQLAGLILLVAMVGAITLTLRRRDDVRRQDIAAQHARRREDVVEIQKVTPGTGV